MLKKYTAERERQTLKKSHAHLDGHKFYIHKSLFYIISRATELMTMRIQMISVQ